MSVRLRPSRVAPSVTPSLPGTPPLRPTRSLADFVASPRDAYVARRCFCFWQLADDHNGVIVWGRPGVVDAREMTVAFETGLTLGAHVSLVDMRDMQSVDVDAFRVILEFMARHATAYAAVVRRQAMVHGTGAVGAAVAGFHRVLTPTYPVDSFRELDAAIEFLAPRDPTGVRDVVVRLRAAYVEAPEVVANVRAVFESEGVVLDLDAMARRLRLARRSLQRELEAAGTTYREVVARFRLERAEQLLVASDEAVKLVAARVGCSPHQLRALFRRAHGASPERWRQRERPLP